MEKEDAEEMYRKWRERKGISKRADVEKETDREKYKRALMEAEEEKDPFETKAIGVGFTEDEASGRREKTRRFFEVSSTGHFLFFLELFRLPKSSHFCSGQWMPLGLEILKPVSDMFFDRFDILATSPSVSPDISHRSQHV